MRGAAVEYLDLIGRPWAEMNCGEVVVEILTRLGAPPGSLDVPLSRDALRAALLDAEGVAGDPSRSRWIEVQAQRRPGDVLLSAPESCAGAHASILIDRPCRFVLTSSKAAGVFVTPVSRVHAPRGWYRFAPLAHTEVPV